MPTFSRFFQSKRTSLPDSPFSSKTSFEMRNSKLLVRLSASVLFALVSLCATALLFIWVQRMSIFAKPHTCRTSKPLIETESQLQPLVRARRKQLDEYIASRSKVFITYGNEAYRKTRTRIANEARNSSFFNKVLLFTPEDLPPSFRHHFREILPMSRGGGYWVWKYYIMSQAMDALDWGDFLIYMDADCTLNPSAKPRFDDYLRLINVSRTGILSVSYIEPERYWTNDRLFREMGLLHNNKFYDSIHLISGVMLFQKTEATMQMLRMWKSVIYSDPYISTDEYNNRTTRPEFREHRHDQSVLSLIRKCVGTAIIPTEVLGEEGPMAPLQIEAIKDWKMNSATDR